MTRRKRIVDTMFKVATVQEREAQLAFGRAQSDQQQAEADVEQLAIEAESGEAELMSGGTLGDVERELLWAHRTWVRQERLVTEERLAATTAQVLAAQSALQAKKQTTHVREKVRDHVVSGERAEREYKAQKEMDDLTTTRWNRHT